MGNSENKKDHLVNNTTKNIDNLYKDKNILGNKIIKNVITKREKIDKEEITKQNIKRVNHKFELNIFIYSDDNLDKYKLNSIKSNDTKIYNWQKKEFIGFSRDKSKEICKKCESDFKENTFKNVVVIPIKSMNFFNSIIEEEKKDIFIDFDKLKVESQPFFLIIDEDENNSDFIVEEVTLSAYETKEGKKELKFKEFSEKIYLNILELKTLDKDFQLKIDFKILLIDTLNKFKEYIFKTKEEHIDFEIYINNKLFYQNLYGIENIDIKKDDNFIGMLREDIILGKILNISLLFYNINSLVYLDYKFFDIKEVKFLSYNFRKFKLNKILRKEKYSHLDKRNFTVIRRWKSPTNNLLKYTGYFNQLGDLVLFSQIPLYLAKINIAVGGYIGSGKSTLINTILREKRCLEGRGSSMTNYISQFALKDYPINFIDFPGFGAKKNGKENSTLFEEEISNKISELKQINEEIHCFLFCIKFEQRIFDETDEELIKVFNSILELKIRTFIVITESEKEDTREFKDYKDIIIKNLENIKKNKNKTKFNKVFGSDLDKNIIPIFSKDKIIHGNKIKAFGLDNLFKILHEYFKDKEIKLKKEIYFDDEKLKYFIEKNELLKIFESKKKLSDAFRKKIEIEVEKFMMKIFLRAPKYIYSFSEENIYEIMNILMEVMFSLGNCYLNHQNDVEKYQMLNILPFQEIKENLFSKSGLKGLEEEIKKMAEDINNSIPWYVKTFFPILSPLYYTFGTILVKFFSEKIINYLLGDEFKPDTIIFDMYFKLLIEFLNKGIDGLEAISEYFAKLYELDNKLLINKGNDEYLDDYKKEIKKLIGLCKKKNNNHNEVKAMNDFIDENQYFELSNDEI